MSLGLEKNISGKRNSPLMLGFTFPLNPLCVPRTENLLSKLMRNLVMIFRGIHRPQTTRQNIVYSFINWQHENNIHNYVGQTLSIFNCFSKVDPLGSQRRNLLFRFHFQIITYPKIRLLKLLGLPATENSKIPTFWEEREAAKIQTMEEQKCHIMSGSQIRVPP